MNTLKDLIKNSFHNFNEKFSLLKNDVFYTVEIQYDLNVEYSDPEIVVCMETKKHKIEFSFHLNSFFNDYYNGDNFEKQYNHFQNSVLNSIRNRYSFVKHNDDSFIKKCFFGGQYIYY
jgi:hypothetical protein